MSDHQSAQNTITEPKTLAEFEQQLRDKAQQGDGMACYQLVEHFEQKALAQNQLEAQNRIQLLQDASNQGIGAASLMLGRWYLTGHYVSKDTAKAILFFELAGKNKESYGFYQLAQMFQTGQGDVPVHAEKGLNYLKKAVELGNPDAIFTYANQLLKQKPEQALQLFKDNFKKNAHVQSLLLINDSNEVDQAKVLQFLQQNQNDAYVAALLAWRYLQDQAIEQALALAEQSAQQDNPIGHHVRALVELERVDGDPELAQHYMLRAAQLGHIEAAYRVGLTLLKQAEQQVDKALGAQLLQQALQYIAQAAQAGYAPAQYSLGQCWMNGIGVEKNPQEGLGWIERAAQQGHIDAMFTLAMHLPTEHEQHLPLLESAAHAGHPKALLCMGIYCQNHAQPEQAIEWFEHAKTRGDIRANFMLGLAYRDGMGVEPDVKYAVDLFNLAGEGGDAEAYFVLYEMYRDGTGVRKNKKSQEKYLKLAQQAKFPAALEQPEPL